MGSCNSSAKVACSESPWLEYADEAGEPYWYNYITGNYTRMRQTCDWYFDMSPGNDKGAWFNARTGEMRYTTPVSQTSVDPRIAAELERIASIVDASLPTATAVYVEASL